ncbi:MAG: hypothetical protein FJY92_12600, partial [Candidatus Hydrogenedentes bacterium]|nr:hypothetical protein [Candidatus Hydrogenedentota bacterium]
MNSRERVIASLARTPVDRVPIFMWFHPDTARLLAQRLEVPAGRVGEAMGNDVVQAWVNNNHAMEGIVHERDGEGHVDDWGVRWEKHGPYNQIVEFPLEGAPPEDMAEYRFPTDRMEALLANMAPVVARRGEFYTGVDVSPCAFEMFWRLRGM